MLFVQMSAVLTIL